MPKYIDADYANSVAKDSFTGQIGITFFQAFHAILEGMPAADVAPVVHGRWIDTGEDDGNGNYAFHCSVCGYTDIHSRSVAVPYCWHCGALMDGKDEDNG